MGSDTVRDLIWNVCVNVLLTCLFFVTTWGNSNAANSTQSSQVCTDIAPIGLANGFIDNSKLSASSIYTDGTNPRKFWGPSQGRLKTGSCWCGGNSNWKEDWIQVDLGIKYQLSGIAIQGDPLDPPNDIEQFYVQLSDDGVNFRNITRVVDEHGHNSIHVSPSRDSDEIRYFWSPVSVTSRIVRIRPIKLLLIGHNAKFCLRFELYGCIPEEKSLFLPVGLENGIIPDAQITASSSHVGEPPYHARLNMRNSWCTDMIANQWIQFDLGLVLEVRALTMQGRFGRTTNDMVSSYFLSFSNASIGIFSFFNASDKQMVFPGNNGTSQDPVFNLFSTPVIARFIRLHPVTGGPSGIGGVAPREYCVRAEIYAQHQTCTARLSSLSNATFYSLSNGARESLALSYDVYSTHAWCADGSTQSKLLVIQFNELQLISGVIISGNPNAESWVTGFNMRLGLDSTKMQLIGSFKGTIGRADVAVNWLKRMRVARLAEIDVTSYVGHKCFRIRVLGCNEVPLQGGVPGTKVREITSNFVLIGIQLPSSVNRSENNTIFLKYACMNTDTSLCLDTTQKALVLEVMGNTTVNVSGLVSGMRYRVTVQIVYEQSVSPKNVFEVRTESKEAASSVAERTSQASKESYTKVAASSKLLESTPVPRTLGKGSLIHVDPTQATGSIYGTLDSSNGFSFPGISTVKGLLWDGPLRSAMVYSTTVMPVVISNASVVTANDSVHLVPSSSPSFQSAWLVVSTKAEQDKADGLQVASDITKSSVNLQSSLPNNFSSWESSFQTVAALSAQLSPSWSTRSPLSTFVPKLSDHLSNRSKVTSSESSINYNQSSNIDRPIELSFGHASSGSGISSLPSLPSFSTIATDTSLRSSIVDTESQSGYSPDQQRTDAIFEHVTPCWITYYINVSSSFGTRSADYTAQMDSQITSTYVTSAETSLSVPSVSSMMRSNNATLMTSLGSIDSVFVNQQRTPSSPSLSSNISRRAEGLLSRSEGPFTFSPTVKTSRGIDSTAATTGGTTTTTTTTGAATTTSTTASTTTTSILSSIVSQVSYSLDSLAASSLRTEVGSLVHSQHSDVLSLQLSSKGRVMATSTAVIDPCINGCNVINRKRRDVLQLIPSIHPSLTSQESSHRIYSSADQEIRGISDSRSENTGNQNTVGSTLTLMRDSVLLLMTSSLGYCPVSVSAQEVVVAVDPVALWQTDLVSQTEPPPQSTTLIQVESSHVSQGLVYPEESTNLIKPDLTTLSPAMATLSSHSFPAPVVASQFPSGAKVSSLQVNEAAPETNFEFSTLTTVTTHTPGLESEPISIISEPGGTLHNLGDTAVSSTSWRLSDPVAFTSDETYSLQMPVESAINTQSLYTSTASLSSWGAFSYSQKDSSSFMPTQEGHSSSITNGIASVSWLTAGFSETVISSLVDSANDVDSSEGNIGFSTLSKEGSPNSDPGVNSAFSFDQPMMSTGSWESGADATSSLSFDQRTRDFFSSSFSLAASTLSTPVFNNAFSFEQPMMSSGSWESGADATSSLSFDQRASDFFSSSVLLAASTLSTPVFNSAFSFEQPMMSSESRESGADTTSSLSFDQRTRDFLSSSVSLAANTVSTPVFNPTASSKSVAGISSQMTPSLSSESLSVQPNRTLQESAHETSSFNTTESTPAKNVYMSSSTPSSSIVNTIELFGSEYLPNFENVKTTPLTSIPEVQSVSSATFSSLSVQATASVLLSPNATSQIVDPIFLVSNPSIKSSSESQTFLSLLHQQSSVWDHTTIDTIDRSMDIISHSSKEGRTYTSANTSASNFVSQTTFSLYAASSIPSSVTNDTRISLAQILSMSASHLSPVQDSSTMIHQSKSSGKTSISVSQVSDSVPAVDSTSIPSDDQVTSLQRHLSSTGLHPSIALETSIQHARSTYLLSALPVSTELLTRSKLGSIVSGALPLTSTAYSPTVSAIPADNINTSVASKNIIISEVTTSGSALYSEVPTTLILSRYSSHQIGTLASSVAFLNVSSHELVVTSSSKISHTNDVSKSVHQTTSSDLSSSWNSVRFSETAALASGFSSDMIKAIITPASVTVASSHGLSATSVSEVTLPSIPSPDISQFPESAVRTVSVPSELSIKPSADNSLATSVTTRSKPTEAGIRASMSSKVILIKSHVASLRYGHSSGSSALDLARVTVSTILELGKTISLEATGIWGSVTSFSLAQPPATTTPFSNHTSTISEIHIQSSEPISATTAIAAARSKVSTEHASQLIVTSSLSSVATETLMTSYTDESILRTQFFSTPSTNPIGQSSVAEGSSTIGKYGTETITSRDIVSPGSSVTRLSPSMSGYGSSSIVPRESSSQWHKHNTMSVISNGESLSSRSTHSASNLSSSSYIPLTQVPPTVYGLAYVPLEVPNAKDVSSAIYRSSLETKIIATYNLLRFKRKRRDATLNGNTAKITILLRRGTSMFVDVVFYVLEGNTMVPAQRTVDILNQMTLKALTQRFGDTVLGPVVVYGTTTVAPTTTVTVAAQWLLGIILINNDPNRNLSTANNIGLFERKISDFYKSDGSATAKVQYRVLEPSNIFYMEFYVRHNGALQTGDVIETFFQGKTVAALSASISWTVIALPYSIHEIKSTDAYHMKMLLKVASGTQFITQSFKDLISTRITVMYREAKYGQIGVQIRGSVTTYVVSLTLPQADEGKVVFFILDRGKVLLAANLVEVFGKLTSNRMATILGLEIISRPAPVTSVIPTATTKSDSYIWIIAVSVAAFLFVLLIITCLFCRWKNGCQEAEKHVFSKDQIQRVDLPSKFDIELKERKMNGDVTMYAQDQYHTKGSKLVSFSSNNHNHNDHVHSKRRKVRKSSDAVSEESTWARPSAANARKKQMIDSASVCSSLQSYDTISSGYLRPKPLPLAQPRSHGRNEDGLEGVKTPTGSDSSWKDATYENCAKEHDHLYESIKQLRRTMEMQRPAAALPPVRQLTYSDVVDDSEAITKKRFKENATYVSQSALERMPSVPEKEEEIPPSLPDAAILSALKQKAELERSKNKLRQKEKALSAQEHLPVAGETRDAGETLDTRDARDTSETRDSREDHRVRKSHKTREDRGVVAKKSKSRGGLWRNRKIHISDYQEVPEKPAVKLNNFFKLDEPSAIEVEASKTENEAVGQSMDLDGVKLHEAKGKIHGLLDDAFSMISGAPLVPWKQRRESKYRSHVYEDSCTAKNEASDFNEANDFNEVNFDTDNSGDTQLPRTPNDTITYHDYLLQKPLASSPPWPLSSPSSAGIRTSSSKTFESSKGGSYLSAPSQSQSGGQLYKISPAPTPYFWTPVQEQHVYLTPVVHSFENQLFSSLEENQDSLEEDPIVEASPIDQSQNPTYRKTLDIRELSPNYSDDSQSLVQYIKRELLKLATSRRERVYEKQAETI